MVTLLKYLYNVRDIFKSSLSMPSTTKRHGQIEYIIKRHVTMLNNIIGAAAWIV